MKAVEHVMTVHGPGALGDRPKPEAVGPIVSFVKPALRDTVRMAFLGASRTVGRPLHVLQGAYDVRFIALRKDKHGATELVFEAPLFGNAAPALYEQDEMWPSQPDQSMTAFDVFAEVLADIRRGNRNSDRYDRGLLSRMSRASRFLKGSVATDVVLSGNHIQKQANARIDQAIVDSAKSMLCDTPLPKRVRIKGKLDMLRVSDRVFELVLDDDTRIRAVWAGSTVVALRDHLAEAVVVEGDAVWRPSGTLLRIDADALAQSNGKSDVFSRMPTPDRSSDTRLTIRERQRAGTGFDAIFGRWPGTETAEELEATLRDFD